MVIDDSPTEAICAHFAARRQNLQRASQMATLLDPPRLWASLVLHALADASGQPVQRLNLPPGAAALRRRILAQAWPPGLQAHALAKPLGSAASVWNCVLAAWEATQAAVAPAPAAVPVATPGPGAATTMQQAVPGMQLPAVLLNRLLLPLARSESLLACGIVDLHTGDLLATQQRDEPATDLATGCRAAAGLGAPRRSNPALKPAAAAADKTGSAVLSARSARHGFLFGLQHP